MSVRMSAEGTLLLPMGIMLYGLGSLDTHSVVNTNLEHIAILLPQFPKC